MKTHWFATITVSLSLLLVFMIFVPVDCAFPILRFPTSHCLVWSSVGNYESISYAYGGWGAVFQTGLGQYYISVWTAPLARIFWGVMGLLVLIDLLSIVVIIRRLATRKVTR